jgi:hypothetical protein
MKTSESQANLVPALFAAKQEFPRIAKTKKGQSGNRNFMYAPLDEINDHVDPVLWKNGLFITQFPEGNELVTRLEHAASGEWRECRMPINEMHANMQSYGIELTYRRRYSVTPILGITTEEDIDIKEKNRQQGIDHTEPRNANGTKQGPGGGSGRDTMRAVFEGLQPEVQNQLRQAAQQADKIMPNVTASIQIMEMAIDNWPDHDRNELKQGIWYLLDSKTRTAISKEQKK